MAFDNYKPIKPFIDIEKGLEAQVNNITNNSFIPGVVGAILTHEGETLGSKFLGPNFGPGITSLGITNPDVKIDQVFTYTDFGQPFVGDITFCYGGQSYINSNDLNGPNIDLDEVNIKMCLITLDNQKSIIKTPIIGRDGTIKTYMNKGDYDITIDAVIVASDNDNEGMNGASSYNGIYPFSIVAKLIKICEAPCPISVTSEYLAQFGILNLVIDSYEISQEEGKYSQQKVTLKCYSDFSETYYSIINY